MSHTDSFTKFTSLNHNLLAEFLASSYSIIERPVFISSKFFVLLF